MFKKYILSVILLLFIYGISQGAYVTESVKYSVEHTTLTRLNVDKGNFTQLTSTQIYTSNLNLNGKNYTFIPTGNNTSLFYVTKDISDISEFNILDALNPVPTDFIVVFTTSANGSHIVQSWVSDINVPNTILIPQGIWHQHIHAARNSFWGFIGNITLTFEGVKISSEGVVTSLFISAPTVNLTSTLAEYNLDMAMGDIDLDVTDRIGLRLIANCSGILWSNDITIAGGGNTASRLDVPTILGGESIFSTINNEIAARKLGDYNLGVSTSTLEDSKVNRAGDIMTGGLVTPEVISSTGIFNNVNVNYNINITTSSAINIGDTTKDGTWRLRIINGELTLQENIKGAFVTQGVFTSK